MTSQNSSKRYISRILRVVQYLWQHPDDDAPLAVLAELAHFSPCHFHRLYHAVTGETVVQTRQRLRLARAALQLQQPQPQVLLQVARRAGYGSSAAFVRAFRQAYGLPPAAYRRQRMAFLQSAIHEENRMHYQPQLRQLATPLAVLCCPHRGSYMQIGQAFDSLNVRTLNLLAADARWFGIYYDDPQSVPEAELRAAACVSYPAEAPLPDGLQRGTIAAGDYLVLTHHGPYSELAAAYQWLYGVWLPQSEWQLAPAPCIEAYLNSPQSTAPKDLLTEIWTPVLPRG